MDTKRNTGKETKKMVKNEMDLRFDARSENEAFARVAVAGFVSVLNPTLEELSEALNTEIVIVDTGGRDLVEAVIYPPEHKQTRRRQIYEQTSSSDSGKA